MVQYMHLLYEQGYSANRGEKMFAAWLAVCPEFSKYGNEKLPRTLRALKGFRRLVPAATRAPLPHQLVSAAAVVASKTQGLLVAVCILVTFLCYLRPSDANRLHGRSFVPPTHITGAWSLLLNASADLHLSKTGAADESVQFDTLGYEWLGEVFEILRRHRHQRSAWTFGYPLVLKLFKWSGLKFKVPHFTPYRLRHSGPSADRLAGTRSLQEIQQRGRWLSHSSVVRYEKASRVASEWHKLEPRLRAFCEYCHTHLQELLIRDAPLPTAHSSWLEL
eukprot:3650286-Amphidinium_carterae.1